MWKTEPLGDEAAAYLSELAQVRSRMFTNAEVSPERLQALDSRQYEIGDILAGFHGVKVVW